MQPYGCLSRANVDDVFKALADPGRRQLLDRLNRRNGQTLKELCEGAGMARQSLAKHLGILEAASLVVSVRRGREKLHYLNAAPINDIAERWIARYDRPRAEALADLKRALEDDTMDETGFHYTTYIKTTAETLWQALTDPAFTFRYWGMAHHSDWRAGSPILAQSAPGGELTDHGQVVLESEPHRRLSYTWHNYQPEHAEIFGWDGERLAELQKERVSRVTFEIEAAGASVKLTVIHEGFQPGSLMLKAVRGGLPPSGGWPQLLAGLKTLLETGETL